MVYYRGFYIKKNSIKKERWRLSHKSRNPTAVQSDLSTLKLSTCTVFSPLKVLGSTIQELCSVFKRTGTVVVEETGLPDSPRVCVSQFGNWPVEQGDGCPTVIVVGHPTNSLEDAISSGVSQAAADFLAGWGSHDCGLVDVMDTIPQVHHVELVRDSLHGGPVRPETVVIHPNVAQDLVDGVHGQRGEIRADEVVRGVRDHLLRCTSVHVHRGDVVVFCRARVEHLQPLNGHGVDGVCDRLVEVARETSFDQQLVAARGLWGCSGQRQTANENNQL